MLTLWSIVQKKQVLHQEKYLTGERGWYCMCIYLTGVLKVFLLQLSRKLKVTARANFFATESIYKKQVNSLLNNLTLVMSNKLPATSYQQQQWTLEKGTVVGHRKGSGIGEKIHHKLPSPCTTTTHALPSWHTNHHTPPMHWNLHAWPSLPIKPNPNPTPAKIATSELHDTAAVGTKLIQLPKVRFWVHL